MQGLKVCLGHSSIHCIRGGIQLERAYSEVFNVEQGNGKVGSLARIHKSYSNGLFGMLQIHSVGCHIGEISFVAPGCADDVAILAENWCADCLMDPDSQRTRLIRLLLNCAVVLSYFGDSQIQSIVKDIEN